MSLLDTALIIRRRQQLRMSRRELGDRLGTNSLFVDRLESGDNHSELTLARLHALAHALAVDPHQLLATPQHPHDDLDEQATTGCLVQQIGAMLAAADSPLPREALAEATTTTLDRIDQTLDVLDRHGRTVGLRISDLDGRITWINDDEASDPDKLAAALRARPVDVWPANAVRLLRRIIDEELHEQQLQSADDQLMLGMLRNAGIVSRDTTLTVAADLADTLTKGDAR